MLADTFFFFTHRPLMVIGSNPFKVSTVLLIISDMKNVEGKTEQNNVCLQGNSEDNNG